MFVRRLCHRRFNWIALIAAFALAWVPTVSRALASLQGEASWAEVCTALGTTRVDSNDPTSGERGQVSVATHLEHCPFCTLGSGLANLPLAVAVPTAALLSHVLPVAFLQGPRTHFAWRSAQPRGPPLSS